MTKHTRSHGDDLRAASRLTTEAIRGVTELVEAMHLAIASGPSLLGRPFAWPVRTAIRPVYATIQGVTQLVAGGVDLVLARLAPVLGDSRPGPAREAVLAALNGVLGDALHERGNPLALDMCLRHRGQPLALTREGLGGALPDATRKVVVLVHGLCMNHLQWLHRGHDHGAALARDLGYTPIYVHYNTGLHISTNGQQLAALLDQLVASWPTPIDDLVLLGHSMGGLVARSACHAGADRTWRTRLRALVTLGSPHHGAPLERGGAWAQLLLGVSPYSAPLARLGKIRSAGITDLRFGDILDEDWHRVDRFAHRADRRRPCPLPTGVSSYTMAATRAASATNLSATDGLVAIASALGIHRSPELTLAFPDSHRWVATQTDHVGLIGAVGYPQLLAWLSR